MGLIKFFESIGHNKLMAIVLSLLLVTAIFLLLVIFIAILQDIFFPEMINITEINATYLKGVVIP